MERKQFTFYRSYYEAVKVLPKKEQVAVILAICNYALNNEEPRLNGTANAIFGLIRPTLDSSRRKAESGKQGGSKTQANDKQTESKTEANCKQTASEKENKKEKENKIENECSLPPISPLSGDDAAAPRSARFTPPSVEDVRAYCQERRNGIDPQAFVDFYASKGWMVGKNKMKDWKAAVRNWERGDSERKAKASNGKPTPKTREQENAERRDGAEWMARYLRR